MAQGQKPTQQWPSNAKAYLYTISCVIALNAADMPAELDVFTSSLRLWG